MVATGYTISIPSFPFLLPILISYLLIPTAFSEDSDLLNKICTNTSGNYTRNSAFSKNLKSLLDILYHKTSSNDGFRIATRGEGDDRAYGLALCRGDVSPEDCEDCIYDARCKITRRCTAREAIVWYDYCLVKYSGSGFFGKIKDENNFVLVNVDNVKKSQRKSFRKMALGLLNNVSKTATETPKLFARGEELFDHQKNVTIYAMAQCSRDLSKDVCLECLKGAVKELPIHNEKGYSVGARVVGESCTVRYEIYTFLKNLASV